MGQTNSLQPRVIHAIDYTILLISAVYKCPVGHESSSTDPRIIDLVGDHNVPFILLHKTGFTKSFEGSVIELVKQGMTVKGIESYVKQMRLRYTASLIVKVHDLLQSSYGVKCPSNLLEIIETCDALRLIKEPFPSNDILCKCFIVDYLHNQDIYSLLMSNIQAQGWISFDHTFKVATNIGYVRPDGKWVTLYKSLFIVMNEVGQVLAWQFTRSTSIDEVTNLLKNLQCRLKNKWVTPGKVYVDNCCQLEQKVKAIFGQDTLVKLDLFHAVQRITSQLPKRHPFFLQCTNDLKMVFRSPTDLGKERKETTPAPAVIIDSLEKFQRKWEYCSSNGWKLVSPKTVHHLSSLKVHVRKGCLSNIEPGCGTNRNEVLHRHINPHFANKSRIGLPLAIALLTVLLYQHNCRIEEKITNKPSIPLALWKHKHGVTEKRKGSTDMSNNTPETHGTCWSGSSVADINDVVLSPSGMQSDYVNVELSAKSLELISLADLLAILENAINLSKVAALMQKLLCDSPLFDYRMLSFCSSVAGVFFDHQKSDEYAQHVQRLDNIVHACGMERQQVPGDGNCCFHSLSLAIISNSDEIRAYKSDFFQIHNLNPDRGASDLAQQLRQVAVKEWQSNPQDYEGFLGCGANVIVEAEKFKQNGVFLGELGNTVLLSLSNGLGLPIIALSSAVNHPLINITPRHMNTPVPLYVAYNQYGVGHYDAIAIPATSQVPSSSLELSADTSKCTCGKNDKTTQTHCMPQQKKYATVTRCPCCKNGTTCTVLCKCKNCSNPFGQRFDPGNTRKRPRHMWQHSVQKSVTLACRCMKNIPAGPHTILEFFLLECSLRYCLKEGIDTTTDNIEIIYNTAAQLSETLQGELPLSTKSTYDVDRFLKEHDHLLLFYKEMHKTYNKICIHYHFDHKI